MCTKQPFRVLEHSVDQLVTEDGRDVVFMMRDPQRDNVLVVVRNGQGELEAVRVNVYGHYRSHEKANPVKFIKRRPRLVRTIKTLEHLIKEGWTKDPSNGVLGTLYAPDKTYSFDLNSLIGDALGKPFNDTDLTLPCIMLHNVEVDE
jgi:hypothetical protein